MEHLNIIQQISFYIQWCKDNKLKPQDFKNLETYFKEIKELEQCGN